MAADLEGTLSAGVAWEGMRSYLIAHDQEQVYKSFFIRQMPRYALYKLRLVSRAKMKEDWILALLALFAGYEAEQMRALGQWVVEKELWPARRRKILAELEAHREEGRRVIITTGQFEPILAEVLRKLEGFEGIGTPLHYENGRFSGKISAKLIQGPRKAEVLQPFTRSGRIYAAYGDTDQDIPMLTLSTRATAVHPDQPLRRYAQVQGWRIVEESSS